MQDLEKFKELFWDAFHRPKLESQNFMDLWSNLEPLNEMLAGPMYAIYSNGNCNYIFEDKARFPDINSVEDFLDYCTMHIHTYHDQISNTQAVDEIEKKDKQLLLYQTDIKMTLAQLAYKIVKKS